jgi:hypothetical protein
MGVEARCRPSKSAAHLHHMKKQPFLHNGPPCCGSHHCHCCCHLCCHHCCCRRCNCPLPLPLLSAIAIAVSIKHRRRHLCRVTISYCCCQRPCCRPLPSPSPSAIAVAIAIGHHHHHAIGHFRELLPWCSKNCIQPIQLQQRMLTLFYCVWTVGGTLIKAG